MSFFIKSVIPLMQSLWPLAALIKRGVEMGEIKKDRETEAQTGVFQALKGELSWPAQIQKMKRSYGRVISLRIFTGRVAGRESSVA